MATCRGSSLVSHSAALSPAWVSPAFPAWMDGWVQAAVCWATAAPQRAPGPAGPSLVRSAPPPCVGGTPGHLLFLNNYRQHFSRLSSFVVALLPTGSSLPTRFPLGREVLSAPAHALPAAGRLQELFRPALILKRRCVSAEAPQNQSEGPSPTAGGSSPHGAHRCGSQSYESPQGQWEAGTPSPQRGGPHPRRGAACTHVRGQQGQGSTLSPRGLMAFSRSAGSIENGTRSV